MEKEWPLEKKGAEPAGERRSAGNSLAVNLTGSIAGGVLMLWLGGAMNSWPMEEASGILYALIAPLLLVPPLWSIFGLVFAGKTLRKQARAELNWTALVAFALALALALAALPGFAAALARVLRF